MIIVYSIDDGRSTVPFIGNRNGFYSILNTGLMMKKLNTPIHLITIYVQINCKIFQIEMFHVLNTFL